MPCFLECEPGRLSLAQIGALFTPPAGCPRSSMLRSTVQHSVGTMTPNNALHRTLDPSARSLSRTHARVKRR